jgi:hypothetical protein
MAGSIVENHRATVLGESYGGLRRELTQKSKVCRKGKLDASDEDGGASQARFWFKVMGKIRKSYERRSRQVGANKTGEGR